MSESEGEEIPCRTNFPIANVGSGEFELFLHFAISPLNTHCIQISLIITLTKTKTIKNKEIRK